MEQVGDEFPMDANGYKIVCEIGLSVHSVVYKAICESVNSAVVAVKVVEIDVLDMVRDVDNNIINSLSHIDHPNILTPHCSFMVHRQLWIVMPFIHAGSLENLVAARFPNGLPEQFLAILLRQLLSALVCLHQLGHVHRNIKPTNIFIDSKGIVKLSDVNVFKSIRYVYDHPDRSVSYWVAPEVGQSNNENEEYSFKSDVWAIGVVALELASGCLPFTDPLVYMAQSLKISRRFPYRMNMFKLLSQNEAVDWKYSFSNLFKDFVRSCLVKDPSGRASTENLLAHPFIEHEHEQDQENVLFSKMSSIDNAKDHMVGGIEEMFENNRDRLKWLMDTMRLEIDSMLKGQKVEIMSWEFDENHFHLKPKKEIEWSNKKEGTIMKEEEKAGRIDVDKVLSSLRESLNNVITQFDMFLKRELEMTKEIERLRGELGAERKRSFELELVMRREIQRVEAELGAEKDRNFHLVLGYRSSKPQNI